MSINNSSTLFISLKESLSSKTAFIIIIFTVELLKLKIPFLSVVKKIILLYPKIDDSEEEFKVFKKLDITLEIKRVDLKDTKNSLSFN